MGAHHSHQSCPNWHTFLRFLQVGRMDGVLLDDFGVLNGRPRVLLGERDLTLGPQVTRRVVVAEAPAGGH